MQREKYKGSLVLARESYKKSEIIPFKRSNLDILINQFSLVIFFIGIIASIIISAIHGDHEGYTLGYFLTFFRMLIIFSSIFPVALSFNHTASRFYFSYLLGSDQDIQRASCLNSNVIDDLG